MRGCGYHSQNSVFINVCVLFSDTEICKFIVPYDIELITVYKKNETSTCSCKVHHFDTNINLL
jgi:hypothetical protein